MLATPDRLSTIRTAQWPSPESLTLAEPPSNRSLRFGIKDLLLAIGVFGYLCGLFLLGTSEVDLEVAIVLGRSAYQFNSRIPMTVACVYALLLLFLFCPVWLVAWLLSRDLVPRLFSITNVLMIFALMAWIVLSELSIVRCPSIVLLCLGTIPLTIAWLVHRSMADRPITRVVVIYFIGLLIADFAVIDAAFARIFVVMY